MKRDKILQSTCALSNAMAMMGSKWKPIILCCIGDRKVRFGQLVAFIDIVSRKVLTDQLRELEYDGLILREESPRVEYSLTDKGLDLLPIFHALEAWEKKHTVVAKAAA